MELKNQWLYRKSETWGGIQSIGKLNTFHFILYPHKTEFETMELTEFIWPGIANLEMELFECRSSVVWKPKFEALAFWSSRKTGWKYCR